MAIQQMYLGLGAVNDIGRIGRAHNISDITASQTVLFEWADAYTHGNNPVTGGGSGLSWNTLQTGQGLFVSGVAAINPDNITGGAWVYNAPTNKASHLNGTDGKTVSTVTAPNGAQGGYTVADANNFSSNNQGAWFSNDDSTTLQGVWSNGFSFTNGPANGFLLQGFGSSSHVCLVFKITINSVSRMYAPNQHINQAVSYGSSGGRSVYIYPLDAAISTFSNIGSYTGSNTIFGSSMFDDWDP